MDDTWVFFWRGGGCCRVVGRSYVCGRADQRGTRKRRPSDETFSVPPQVDRCPASEQQHNEALLVAEGRQHEGCQAHVIHAHLRRRLARLRGRANVGEVAEGELLVDVTAGLQPALDHGLVARGERLAHIGVSYI